MNEETGCAKIKKVPIRQWYPLSSVNDLSDVQTLEVTKMVKKSINKYAA